MKNWLRVSCFFFGILALSGCEEILDEMAPAEGQANNPPPQAIDHGNLSVSVTQGVPLAGILLPGSTHNHVLNVVLEADQVEGIVVNSIRFRLDGNIRPENIENVALFDPARNRWLMGIAAVNNDDGTFVVHMNQAFPILRDEELILEVKVDIGENADEHWFSLCPTEVNWTGQASAHNGTSFAAEGTCGEEFDVYASGYLQLANVPEQHHEEPLGYGDLICFTVTAHNSDMALTRVAGEIWQQNRQLFEAGVNLFRVRTGEALEHRAVGQNGQIGMFEFMTDDREFVISEGQTEEFCVQGMLNRASALSITITRVEAVDIVTGENVEAQFPRPIERNFIAGNLD